jgi:hypothetical protein
VLQFYLVIISMQLNTYKKKMKIVFNKSKDSKSYFLCQANLRIIPVVTWLLSKLSPRSLTCRSLFYPLGLCWVSINSAKRLPNWQPFCFALAEPSRMASWFSLSAPISFAGKVRFPTKEMSKTKRTLWNRWPVQKWLLEAQIASQPASQTGPCKSSRKTL